MLKKQLTVYRNGIPQDMPVGEQETILKILRDGGLAMEAVCGGRGVCGKCAVQILRNPPSATDAAVRFFSKEALENGWRLACETRAAACMEIALNSRDGFSIVSDWDSLENFSAADWYRPEQGNVYGLAIDIGTTTVAFALLNGRDGSVVARHATVNSQRNVGADVLTRIQQACDGQLEALRQYIVSDIRESIEHLCKEAAVDFSLVSRVCISGNTTMLHILCGVSCETLGQFPFSPIFIEMKRYPFGELFGGDLLSCEVVLLPGISAFVGADVMAGLLYCDGFNREKPCLLIDLGTNGEIALFSKEGVLSTSTAAGPAFEAGNISQGTGSVPGAIAAVSYQPDKNVYSYETIGHKPPIGICGSGVLDIVAELIKHGLIDETGRLDDVYFEKGVPIAPAAGIVFSQKDIRELQLAKSAVRSGLEILLLVSGLGYSDIDKVFLAGGFGYALDIESAKAIGILPSELCSKVLAVGNSSLGGCARVLLSSQAEQAIERAAKSAKEINLSAHPLFNDFFMEYMMFA